MKITILATLAVLLASGTPSPPVPVPETTPVPTASIRTEHAGLLEELRHVEAWVESLDAVTPAERAKLVRRTVFFLEEHLVAHIAWEERRLYPAVEARAFGVPAVTEPMRHEHEILLRWLGRLDSEARAPAADLAAFERHAHNLLGLLTAHIETENEILLPLLDGSMTKEEFEREVGIGTHGGPT